MGVPRSQSPALLIVAVFSRHEAALDWARARLEERFGPVGLASDPYDFNQTSYYEATMGADLRKLFLAFKRLVPADTLPDAKLATNVIEEELIASARFPEARPLNLDPGFLTLGKFMLATTKDQQHRIYLRDSIFAEVTLRFQNKSYEPWPWTYADYREEFVIAFLNEARAYFRRLLKAGV